MEILLKRHEMWNRDPSLEGCACATNIKSGYSYQGGKPLFMGAGGA
jgi:hypothetical protein